MGLDQGRPKASRTTKRQIRVDQMELKFTNWIDPKYNFLIYINQLYEYFNI